MIKLILSNLLISNYFLAQLSCGWQEDRVFPSAIGLTSRQFYYFAMAIFLWFYPPVKSPEHLFFLFILACLMTYLFLVFFRNSIFSLFRYLDILRSVSLQKGGIFKTIISIIVTGFGLLTFGIATAIKIVGYFS